MRQKQWATFDHWIFWGLSLLIPILTVTLLVECEVELYTVSYNLYIPFELSNNSNLFITLLFIILTLSTYLELLYPFSTFSSYYNFISSTWTKPQFKALICASYLSCWYDENMYTIMLAPYSMREFNWHFAY